MPRDYKNVRAHEKKPLPGFLWFLAGLGIGLFVAFLFYLDGQPDNKTTFTQAVKQELEKIKKPPSESKAELKEEKISDKKNDKEPRFNFYTILPELEVLIPESELQSSPKENYNTSNQKGKQYILQAGSFKNKADADKRKATLALLGLEASIQRVTVNDEIWHRVRVGPFDNSTELYKNKSLLHQNDIKAIAMELKQ